jgi:hypothetical protein
MDLALEAIRNKDIGALALIKEEDPWKQRTLCEAAAASEFEEALLYFYRKEYEWDHRTYRAAADDHTRLWLEFHGCPKRRVTTDVLNALLTVVAERFSDKDEGTYTFLCGEIQGLHRTLQQYKKSWIEHKEELHKEKFIRNVLLMIIVVLLALLINAV